MSLPRHPKPNNWTPERIALLTKLWADEHTASEIVERLPMFSRSGVIAKARRLGLASRGSPILQKGVGKRAGHNADRDALRKARMIERMMAGRKAAKERRENTPKEISPEPALALVLQPKTGRKEIGPEPTNLITLEQAQARNGCRWPSGHRPSMMFCGKDRSAHDVSYCPEHHARAWKGAA